MIIERTCPRCGATIHDVVPRSPGRPRRWCSQRCRRAASEERRAARNGAIGIEYVVPQLDLDAHVVAVLESPAACRRVLRELRERKDTGRLAEARWSGVTEEIDRLARPRRDALPQWGRR